MLAVPKQSGMTEKLREAGQWWRMALIPAFRRQREEDLYEFKASLVNRASSRTVSWRNPVKKLSKGKREKERKEKHYMLN